MPYAAAGIVQQDPIEGGIEITEEQYFEAIEGMCAGLMVSIEGGFKVIEVPPPAPVIPPEPTLEELANQARGQRDYLLSVAAIRIAPLQDAADLDEATTAEVALLKKWKQYRVAVNRVPDQPDYPLSITWPVEPS
ncbi:virus tail fibre assembly protein, lambda gpK [Pseudomonas cedrina]|uniref:Virus tail fibre assembly protein, lambda gpK n=1 Tax=Pseudomonas cedrina TaxID=651740 RepID=A0ABY0UZA0_PSECE|nr:tail fiber assembly protein [Pseudomonas cedrina]SDT41715.1 virus tail fibre assembly protein, lambda gpK [Pseudomonas cedrina]